MKKIKRFSECYYKLYEGEPSRPLKYCPKNVSREVIFSIIRNKETVPTNEPWTITYDEIIWLLLDSFDMLRKQYTGRQTPLDAIPDAVSNLEKVREILDWRNDNMERSQIWTETLR